MLKGTEENGVKKHLNNIEQIMVLQKWYPAFLEIDIKKKTGKEVDDRWKRQRKEAEER